MPDDFRRSDEEWKKVLSDEEFRITRKKGTERPFSGRYVDTKAEGVYLCVCCAQVLFSSQAKYDSGSGWPSYYEPVDESAVMTAEDKTLDGPHRGLMLEVETTSAISYDDGPATGKRYCINSASLRLEEQK